MSVKISHINHFVERVSSQTHGWNEKQLSTEGKEILLKAVAQAIPVYAMPVFKIPKGICKEITDEIAKFWCGDDQHNKRMHWWAWWKLCFPKKDGGMVFETFTPST